MSDSDNVKHHEIIASVLACVLGGLGVVAFVVGYPVLGLIGMIGFVASLIWMILSTPAKSNTKGEGEASSSFAVVGYSCGGGGTGGDCGGAG